MLVSVHLPRGCGSRISSLFVATEYAGREVQSVIVDKGKRNGAICVGDPMYGLSALCELAIGRCTGQCYALFLHGFGGGRSR